MIAINLVETKNIDGIYDDLATKISNSLNGKALRYTHNGIDSKMESKEEIKNFLLSKDFFNYDFDDSSLDSEKIEFIKDLCNLSVQGNKKARSGETKTESKDYTTFINQHKEKSYCQELIKHFETITEPTEGKKKSRKKISDSLKKEAIKMYYEQHQDVVDSHDIFKYSDLGRDNKSIIKSDMDVPVCPYCNIDYTYSFTNNEKKNTSTADLDHFYVQSKYSQYSLCLYNFIPSCQVCNSRMKLRKKMTVNTHIYPHKESFEKKAKFEVSNLVDVYLNGNMPVLKLNIYNDEDKRVAKSNDVFEIENRYEYHKGYAKELLEKSVIYNETYREELNETMTSIFKKNYNIKSLIFGNELLEEDTRKISLGKLKRDLLKQFSIY